MTLPNHFDTHKFSLRGRLTPLVGMRKSGGHRPTRPMGGWLMTYGKIGPDGGVVPTRDRDGQVMEAARELGHIDWEPYLTNGKWNDTHKEDIIVGLPSTLEFHDGTTELSKEHGKLGFWTTGHLFDRNDAASWQAYGDYVPNERDLDRADHFWTLATLLRGLPRPIGFSAHGDMALSPCRSRIIWCEVRQSAVCELPKNPDSTAEALIKAELDKAPIEIMRKGMVGRKKCGACTCPPWACEGLLRKSQTAIPDASPSHGGGDPGDAGGEHGFPTTLSDSVERMSATLQQQYFIDRPTALRWIKEHLGEALQARARDSHSL